METSHSIFCNFVFALGTFFQLLGRPGKMVIKCAASAFNSRKEGERVHSVVGVVGRFYSFVLSLQVTSKNEERSEFHPHQWCPVPKLPQASTSTIFSKPRYPEKGSGEIQKKKRSLSCLDSLTADTPTQAEALALECCSKGRSTHGQHNSLLHCTYHKEMLGMMRFCFVRMLHVGIPINCPFSFNSAPPLLPP